MLHIYRKSHADSQVLLLCASSKYLVIVQLYGAVNKLTTFLLTPNHKA